MLRSTENWFIQALTRSIISKSSSNLIKTLSTPLEFALSNFAFLVYYTHRPISSFCLVPRAIYAYYFLKNSILFQPANLVSVHLCIVNLFICCFYYQGSLRLPVRCISTSGRLLDTVQPINVENKNLTEQHGHLYRSDL